MFSWPRGVCIASALVLSLASVSPNLSWARSPQFDSAALLTPQPTSFAQCSQFFANGVPPAATPRPQLRELCYEAFAVLHSGATRTPVFVAQRLNRQSVEDADEKRAKRFFADARLPSGERAELDDYKNSGYSRGHMAPAGDMPSFVTQSAEAFSYDDGIRFVRRGDRLEIEELKPDHSAQRDSESQKLERLHLYWLYRGMDALMESPALLALVGPEHLEANLQAFAKAMGTWLQLQEVYGIADKVKTETGMTADVFRSLLALEMMKVFFIHDFLQPFAKSYQQCTSARQALAVLALSGMHQQDMQNRFPITWSDKVIKINRIKAWTVSAQFPQGNAKAAEAILDFWTSDWTILASQLRNGQSGLVPELFERPMLKMGTRLFQLP